MSEIYLSIITIINYIEFNACKENNSNHLYSSKKYESQRNLQLMTLITLVILIAGIINAFD